MPRIYRIEPDEPGLDNDPADTVIGEIERVVQTGENITSIIELPRQMPRRNTWLIITDGETEKQEKRG